MLQMLYIDLAPKKTTALFQSYTFLKFDTRQKKKHFTRFRQAQP